MNIKTFFISAACLVASNSLLAADYPDWGNPYDLYVGQVTYAGNNGHGHTGTHGSVVGGGSWSECQGRLGEAEYYHSSAGDSFVNKTNCSLKTTVLFQPQIASPDSSIGNTGTKPIHLELNALEESYDISGYQQQLQLLMKRYNIEGFRKDFVLLHTKSLVVESKTSVEKSR